MSAPDYPNPAERLEVTERELVVATLVGRYIERREHRRSLRVHDLLAAAAEFGAAPVDELRSVLAFYEALRAGEADDR